MKHIYLIRHSLPMKKKVFMGADIFSRQEWNERLPLSPEGEAQARAMAQTLFPDGVDSIWSSPYLRTLSTAKYIADLSGVPIHLDRDLEERKTGNTNGVPEIFWLIQLQDENAVPPGGECRLEVTERMLRGIHRVLESIPNGGRAAVVSHGAAITFLLMHWCELKEARIEDKSRWLTWQGKTVINAPLRTPEVFLLDFEGYEPVCIQNIRW